MGKNTNSGCVSLILLFVLLCGNWYNDHSKQVKAMESYQKRVERKILDAVVDMCDAENSSELQSTIDELSSFIEEITPEYWETKETKCSKAFKITKRKPTPPKPAKQWSAGLALGLLPFPTDYSIYVGDLCVRKKEIMHCRRRGGYGSLDQDIIFDEKQDIAYLVGYEGNVIESFLTLSRCNVVEKRPHSKDGEAFCLTDSLVKHEEDDFVHCSKDSILILRSKQNGGESEKVFTGGKNLCAEQVKKILGYVPKKSRGMSNVPTDKDYKRLWR